MVKFLLDTPATFIVSITGEVHDAEGIHDRPRAGEFFGACTLKPRESIHRDDPNVLAPRVGLGSQPGFEDPLGSARDHVQEPGGTATVSHGSYIQDDGDVFVAVGGVAPHMFIHANGTHPLETIGNVDNVCAGLHLGPRCWWRYRTCLGPGRCAPPSDGGPPGP